LQNALEVSDRFVEVEQFPSNSASALRLTRSSCEMRYLRCGHFARHKAQLAAGGAAHGSIGEKWLLMFMLALLESTLKVTCSVSLYTYPTSSSPGSTTRSRVVALRDCGTAAKDPIGSSAEELGRSTCRFHWYARVTSFGSLASSAALRRALNTFCADRKMVAAEPATVMLGRRASHEGALAKERGLGAT